MANVFVSGISVVDFVFRVACLPDEPMKYRTHDAEIAGGGCAANAAVAIRKLGGTAMLATRLGDDLVSELNFRELRKEKVNLDFVQREKGGRAPFSSVSIDPEGERQIVNFRGAGLIEDPSWLDSAPDSDAFLVDTTWVSGAARILDRARKLGRAGIVDGDAPAPLEVLRKASHIAFSRQGLAEQTGETNIAEGLRAVAGSIRAWVCVTDGKYGVFRLRRGLADQIPACDVIAKDTLAAGDVWHGAFALRLAEGADEDDSVRFANAAAALKCTCQGGRECFPKRSEVERFLRKSK